MFGLMKNTGCMKSDQQDWYRLHYCGTCKSMGRMYGQRSRILLNFDCVFLAELLSVIQEADTETWDAKLASQNCFSLPREEVIPLSLKYAADMNLILAEMKLRDNLQDDGIKFIWKTAQRFFKRPFTKIQDRLTVWEIDVQLLMKHQAEDARRETLGAESDDIPTLLSWYAAPTAAITSYLFSKGADAVQQPVWRDTMSRIGAAFGELVYGLDAWKDVELDEINEDFNLLLVGPEEFHETSKEAAVDWIWEKAEEIREIIHEAPFSSEVKASLTSRLMLNLASALGEEPKVCTPQSGLEKSTVPAVARTIGGLGRLANPLKPVRFAASYIALLLVIFHQQLFAAADLGAESSFSVNYALLAGLIAAPMGFYFAVKRISNNRERFVQKLQRKQKRILKEIQRLKRKAASKDSKVDWPLWIMLSLWILGLIAVIVLLVLIMNCCIECVDACTNCDTPDC
jgi:hypothetical protein